MDTNMILDKKERRLLERGSEAPENVNAVLKVQGTRYFAVIIALLVVLLVQVIYTGQANERAEVNREIIWMKMYPDGTFDLEFQAPSNTQEFFRTTIDAKLADYVKHRFGRNPTTVRNDFGFALQFMSSKLDGEFQSPSGFNATQVAANLMANPNGDFTEIEVGAVDHYDVAAGQFTNESGAVYKSYVFYEAIDKTNLGVEKDRKRYRVSLHWRLMGKDELVHKSLLFFRANPLGMQILEENVYEDVAVARPADGA